MTARIIVQTHTNEPHKTVAPFEKGNKGMSNTSSGRLAILHILLSITETSGAYNQHCLAVADQRDITICTFFQSKILPPPEITLFHGDGTFIGFFRALKAALSAREYDIIHAHSPHVGFLFLAANPFLAGRRLHISAFNVQNSYQNYKRRNKWLHLPVFAFFRSVICCSHACLESFPRLYQWLAGDRLSVIPNGLDITRVDRAIARLQKDVPDSDFTVASVGRLIEIKNPMAILRAFGQGRDDNSRLVFIGEGPLCESLMAERDTLGLGDRVVFTGLIPRDQVFERVNRADVYISASRGEGLPVAVIEAMACRRPVILSDIEPHREIADGVDIIPLVHPDDVAGFAREIARFRRMPAAERAAVGERCRKLVEERYSLTTMHRRYEDGYRQLLGAPASSRQHPYHAD